jgi:aminoacyl tRNA synthase complex-interacting multifunctional protein 1
MASDSDVVQRLEERAKEAEDTIELLKKHLEDLTDKAANAGILKEREEATQLRKQNDALKQEINEMRKELTELESKNQRLQVPLPVPGQKPPHYPNPPPVQAYVNGPSVQPVKGAPQPATSTAIVMEEKETGEVTKSKKKEKGKKETSPSPAKTSGDSQKIDVSRLNIKVGQIVAVKNHPDADTLYVEEGLCQRV